MLSINETIILYNNLKSNNFDNKELYDNSLKKIQDLFLNKFQEVENIYKQIDNEGLINFIELSNIYNYNENDIVFIKGQKCISYYFLLYGDISLFSEDKNLKESKLLKTISSGLVFGHKVKDDFQYFAYSKNNTLILEISKFDFDNQMEELQNRLKKNKEIFLKKYFPGVRTLKVDDFSKINERFHLLKCQKGTKIIVDGEYDEYINIIISGEFGGLKNIKKIKCLVTKDINELKNKTHVIIEKYCKFIIFILFK